MFFAPSVEIDDGRVRGSSVRITGKDPAGGGGSVLNARGVLIS